MRYTSFEHRNPEYLTMKKQDHPTPVGNLKLMLSEGETVQIASDVFVTVKELGKYRVELSFEAPRSIPINRVRDDH